MENEKSLMDKIRDFIQKPTPAPTQSPWQKMDATMADTPQKKMRDAFRDRSVLP